MLTIKNKPTHIGLKLLPEYKEKFAILAKQQDMTLSELMRRAAFVVEQKPELLKSVDEQEASYVDKLGPSRWTPNSD